MPIRKGRYTLEFVNAPVIAGSASVVGKKEGEGPLGGEFDKIYDDTTIGEQTWEKAESAMHRDAVTRALASADVSSSDVDLFFGGDLLNQCVGTAFGIKEMEMPCVGLYGACSTMALGLAFAALAAETGIAQTVVAATSSHFCSAEKQFRMPLEYGNQSPPYAQRTATAAGAAVVKSSGSGVKIQSVIIGKIKDLNVKDSNNMGAAMAPAACQTIIDFLRDTNTKPEDYDMILTGDLGDVGSRLLIELLQRQENTDISSVHADCGLMLYDLSNSDINSGGSGCGCSASIVCSYIMRRLKAGELKKVFFVGTGALLSAITPLQGDSIPGIAHGVLLVSG